MSATAGGPPDAAAQSYPPLIPTFSTYTASAPAAVRLTWRATIAASALLAVLVVGGPALRRWYVGSAVESRPAQMTSIDGVVFVRRQGTGDWLMAKPDERVDPGDVLRTAANARAFVRLFDQSTVLLYPSSTIQVLRAEQGRFHRERGTVVLDLSGGRARVGVAPAPESGSTFFQLRTPQASMHLQEGSYSADVTDQASQVSVRIGEATAHAAAGSASAGQGQRLVVSGGRAPVGGLPARRDLVENALFAAKDGASPAGWTVRDLSEQPPEGTVSMAKIPGAITFERTGSGHGETLIAQSLDVDLWDFEKLTLTANVRVLSHSLSGGGWQGREFPLMLRVIYRDAAGGQTSWYRGFYLQNPDGYPVIDGQRLPSTDWQHVEVNLLELVPRPWRIVRVEVVATGWDYTSAVGEFHLWAE
jgi:hypothetical protein